MAASEPDSVNLQAYLERIGYVGPLTPTWDVLDGLHFAHATHIPFENLDIPLGRPIRLDLASVQAKLVGARRGGYCFEQNRLFAAVLEEVGFKVTRLAARVRLGSTRIGPRVHMLLTVDLGGQAWLADVGFGREGLLKPILLAPGEISRQFAWVYRVVEDAGLWILQVPRGEIWEDVYAFTLEPQADIDYELANYYTATHPESRFVQTFTAQLPSPDARYVVRNWEFAVMRNGLETTQPLRDNDELLRVLADVFGLTFPPGTLFPPRLPKD